MAQIINQLIFDSNSPSANTAVMNESLTGKIYPTNFETLAFVNYETLANCGAWED